MKLDNREEMTDREYQVFQALKQLGAQMQSPKQNDIARACGCSRVRVTQIIADLERKGYISAERGKSGKARHGQYRIVYFRKIRRGRKEVPNARATA
ncbi:MAG: helix-turn-helix transcriptional regulator [Terriglobales bacterium]